MNPYLLLTLTALVWGGNAVAGKLAAGHVSPFLLVFLRWTFACVVLLPFAWIHLRKDADVIKQNLLYLFLMGATGFAVFNNLMYLSLNYTTAINVAIEQASMPLIVFALNYILYRTGITFFQILGFSLTLLGVAITVTRGNLFSIVDLNLNIGDLLMICAVGFYGVYSAFLGKKPTMHLFSFLFVLGISAFMTSIPFAAYEYASGTMLWPDYQGWGVVVYAALFPSLVSQLFWVMGLERIGSNRGGIFINLVPIFGALLAVVILGEQFQIFHGLCFITSKQ